MKLDIVTDQHDARPGVATQEIDESTALLEEWANRDYKWGFTSNVEADQFEPGLNEDVIRALSLKKE